MNRWPLRWKIAVCFSLLATAVFLVTGIYIHGVVVGNQMRILHRELAAQTRLAAIIIDRELESPGDLQGIIDRIDTRSGARATIIAADGTVLADSREEADVMENHADRPERLAALESGTGTATRHSATLGIDMLYVAQELTGPPDTVVRLALPLSEIRATARRVEVAMLVAFVGALVAIWLISTRLAATLTAPVDRLVGVARRLAGGDLEARSDIQSGRLAELASAFNESLDRLEDRVRKSEREARHYAAILAQMTDAVVVIDPEGIILFVNEAFSRLFDVADEQVQGQYIDEIALNYQLSALLTRAARQGTMQRGEVRVLHPKPRDLITVATPLRGDEEGVTGVIGLLHDATEILRMDQVRRDFVANASHELRTPATSIKSMAEVLAAGAMDDEKRGPVFVERIIEASDRLTRLLDDMLTLTRVERGQELLNVEWVNAPAAFEEALDHIQATAEAKGVSLGIEYGDSDDQQVYVDGPSLQTVLINLLENAVKYTPSGGEVILRGHNVPGGYQVSVTDTGIGIPENEHSRIFERFYRVDKARGRDSGGTGLGLAIVKNIAGAHGGRVQVRSKPGQGSTFSVFFPAPDSETG